MKGGLLEVLQETDAKISKEIFVPIYILFLTKDVSLLPNCKKGVNFYY